MNLETITERYKENLEKAEKLFIREIELEEALKTNPYRLDSLRKNYVLFKKIIKEYHKEIIYIGLIIIIVHRTGDIKITVPILKQVVMC